MKSVYCAVGTGSLNKADYTSSLKGKTETARLVGHVASMEVRRDPYMVLVRKPQGKSHLEDLSVDGRIPLQWN
jgi:hypothetical protein